MADYFTHDYHARHDPKLLRLLKAQGLEGIGIFWCLVEFAYEQGGTIKKEDIDDLAYDMRTQCDGIAKALNDYGLFEKTQNGWKSPSISKRLEIRKAVSEKASNSANKRWNHAKAMPRQCQGNALKESKGKESKEKKEERESEALAQMKCDRQLWDAWIRHRNQGTDPYLQEMQFSELLKIAPSTEPEKQNEVILNAINKNLRALCRPFEWDPKPKKVNGVYDDSAKWDIELKTPVTPDSEIF